MYRILHQKYWRICVFTYNKHIKLSKALSWALWVLVNYQIQKEGQIFSQSVRNADCSGTCDVTWSGGGLVKASLSQVVWVCTDSRELVSEFNWIRQWVLEGWRIGCSCQEKTTVICSFLSYILIAVQHSIVRIFMLYYIFIEV